MGRLMNLPAPCTSPPLGDFALLAERILFSGFAIMGVLVMLSVIWEMLRRR